MLIIKTLVLGKSDSAIQFKRGLARALGLNLVTGSLGLNIRALSQFPPLIGFLARARSSAFCNQSIGWFSNSFEIVHVQAIAELARCCINKLLALKVKPPSFSASINHFKSHRTISTQCIELEKEEEEDGPKNCALQSILRHPSPEISCFFRKGFSEITTPIDGRALHALCITAPIKLSTFHMNTLINMYNKFDNIAYACYLFDTLPHRNESSWNTMISGFVRAGFFSEAIDLFRAMIQHGFHPNGFVVASLITACKRAGKFFERGLQVHGFVLKLGLLYDVFVSTAVLHFYGAYGYSSDAQRFFEEMPYRNVVSWTSLMVAYSEIGNPSEVLKIYKRMRSEGVECNQNTYSTVISSCGLLEDENLGHQVLGHVIKFRLEINVSVANSLISMFDNFNSMEEAVYIFHNMNDYDVISWNSIISAYAHNGLCEDSLECFHQMRHGHYEPDSTTLSSLLMACSSTDNFEWGKGIHGLVVKVGLDSNICVCNTLLTMYSEVEGSDAAESFFQNMIDRDLISWNCMMTCYAQDGKSLSALQLLAELLWTGKSMNHVTFAGAISACSKPDLSAEGKILHALVKTIGLHDNLVVGNALITMYGKYGMMMEADQVFKIMCRSDVVTWNALIGGYAENEQPNEALKVFKLMREGDEDPNYITFVNVLGAFTSANDLVNHGMPIHAHIALKGFESNDYVKNSLITMYAECGDLKSSSIIFDGLAYKSSVTWNAMVAANARHGCGEEALKLFRAMHCAGVGLDQFSFSGALAATANLAMLEEGQQLHSLFIKFGFDSNIHVINAAMDMYAKCGEMNVVLKIVPEPIKRSQLSWNVLISAFSRHGYFQKARATFHEMLELGSKPNHVTFVSLLSACNHGGLVDEGLSYFASMTTEFGVPAAIEHCVCIIDLLGRSGRLSDAETFVKDMPVSPNDLVWRSLLAACRTHGDLELGKKAAKHLLDLDPSDDSAYVLYSNVFTTSGRWEDAENVRRQMKSKNIKKQPACSWVKLKNRISSFGIGDRSHPQVEQICAKLEEIRKMIKEAGYVPDTRFELHDTDEEQKEHNLWNHSERLALAYGLINAPEASTVKIFKNLRVCGDCHSVFKFVSGIVGKKIVLRDPYRFHHFSGGKCSCEDYW